jgi:hypothetical protein
MATPATQVPFTNVENAALLTALLDRMKHHDTAMLSRMQLSDDSIRHLRPKFLELGSSINPIFEGRNATLFIKRFESLLKKYEPNATDVEKAELLELNVEYNR